MKYKKRFNNTNIKYTFNKLHFFIKRIINKNLKSKICFWCKSEHLKPSLFCSKQCENAYHFEKYQIFKHNNRCKKHKNESLTYRNQCWGCFKEEAKSGKWPRVRKMFILWLNGFKLAPTFRTSKYSWNGDKIAFEQYLKDKKIKWFVYIKFYVNKNGKIKPIVVGKSGSIFVNRSGTDLNFSTNVSHGPARKFIAYNNFQWYYDKIAIKKCKNQFHAYEVEKRIMDKFDLFGS